MTRTWRIFAATLIFLGSVWAQQCYLPNGSLAPSNDTYVACGDGSKPSQCCTDRDECTTNGLCKGSLQNEINWYWRESCTDPTWQSDACPKYCMNESLDPGSTGEDHLVFACSSTTYCCAAVPRYIAIELPLQNNYSCCNDPSRVFDAGPAVRLSGKFVETSTFASTSGPTSTSGSTTVSSSVSSPTITMTTVTTVSTSAASATTSPSTPNNSESPPTKHGLTKSDIIGIAIGVVAAVCILAGITYFIWRYIRNHKLNNATFTPIPPYEVPDHKALIPEMYVPPDQAGKPVMYHIHRKPVAAPGQGGFPIVELPGRSHDTWI